MKNISYAMVPMRTVGPIAIDFGDGVEQVKVPLATYESPMWPSTGRGARISRACGGIKAFVYREQMTRSVIVQGPSAEQLAKHRQTLQQRRSDLEAVTGTTSRFAKLVDVFDEIVGNLWFVRFSFRTGDASGHNMATKAADALLSWLLQTFPDLEYVSISGNMCTDKKVSAINAIQGRGKHVIAELSIPRELCQKQLRCEPEQIVSLNTKKNLLGTSLAGGLRSGNAHVANALLAFYLATGQDAANIVEGSQAYTYCDIVDDQLYFSVNLPNIIVGTVGNGKDLEFVGENLKMMGCKQETTHPGENATRLACIAGAAALCTELSLLAAQANPGELIRSHVALERRDQG